MQGRCACDGQVRTVSHTVLQTVQQTPPTGLLGLAEHSPQEPARAVPAVCGWSGTACKRRAPPQQRTVQSTVLSDRQVIRRAVHHVCAVQRQVSRAICRDEWEKGRNPFVLCRSGTSRSALSRVTTMPITQP